MRRIYAYSFSLLLLLSATGLRSAAQDTIPVPLKIRFGIDLSGPVKYALNKDIFEIEGYAGIDLNEKLSVMAEAGYLDYYYEQYNFRYLNKGYFMEAGANVSILNIKKTKGRYFGGLALRYGLSRYTHESPAFYSENYWGKAESSVPAQTKWGHYVEFSPSVRAELLKNLSIGWSLDVRMLLYTGAGDDFRPLYFPGFGNAGQMFSTGFRYYIELSIPWKKINVITRPEEPEPAEEEVADTRR